MIGPIHNAVICYIVVCSFLFISSQLACAQHVSDSDFVLVKGDCFEMGDHFGDGADDERPVHEVCLSDFFISKYEVTQKQWQSVMGNNPSLDQTNSHYPVDVVSWWDVEKYIQKFNAQTNQKYRLPTEAEWEFACRAGGKIVKYGTQDGSLSEKMVIHSGDEKNGQGIMPVGSFPPNELGLYDMSGNVSEWVMDWYDRKAYEKGPVRNPVVMQTRLKTLKVRRGGHWADQGRVLRCMFRNYRSPGFRLIGLGFRLAKDS